jgi:hypothetical protein
MRAMTAQPRPELAELTIADPPDHWRELGFDVHEDGHFDLGGVRITLGVDGGGITSWSLRNIPETDSIDGLVTTAPSLPTPAPAVTHPNGALGVDHVVVLTNEFGRTSLLLEQLGIPITYTREMSNGSRGFVRVGPAILELVHVRQLESPLACFWGVAMIVEDLDALARRLGANLGRIHTAMQPGRRIATVRASAGLSPAVAFITPKPA